MLFPVAIERGDETDAYGVAVPDLPGCFSAGDRWDQALAGARQAIAGHLGVMSEHGDGIPRAGVIEDHIDATVSCNPAYKTRSGFLAEAALHELSRQG